MANILFIGLDYHDYTKSIAQEFARTLGKVDYHSIQPRNFLFKAIRRISSSRWQSMLDSHHASIIEHIRVDHYDFVIFIQAHQFSEQNLRKLKESQKRARFILYNWDSVKTHDYRDKMWAFDKVSTFDPDDAKSLGIEYLPLFCLPEFYKLEELQKKRSDVYFVGNIGTLRRFLALKAFTRYCKENDISFRSHMVASPYIFLQVIFAGHSPMTLRLSSVSPREIAEMMQTSTAVFDFANHIQSGLTMRTIENLCAGMKIITSNKRVLEEPFFSPDRILVYGDLDFSGVKDFLKKPLDLPAERFDQYHLPAFVQHLVAIDRQLTNSDISRYERTL